MTLSTLLQIDLNDVGQAIKVIVNIIKTDSTFKQKIRDFASELNLILKENPTDESEWKNVDAMAPHCPKCEKRFEYSSEVVKHYKAVHGQAERGDEKSTEEEDDLYETSTNVYNRCD